MQDLVASTASWRRAPTTRCTWGSPRRAWAPRASWRTAGLAILLQEGIGDTIRVSLTPRPGGDRTEEVQVAQQILQSLGIRSFPPQVTACPGCGRTTSTFFQEMAEEIQAYLRDQMPVWRDALPRRGGAEGGGDGVRGQRPGRVQARQHRHLASRHLRGAQGPGLRGRRAQVTLKGDAIVAEFLRILDDYVEGRFAGSRK